MTDDLGDRMKSYEAVSTGPRAFKGQPIICRLDGKAFHTFTKGLVRPFDVRLINLMVETMSFLVERFNPLVGYTQSDEITLVFYEESWSARAYPFDGRFQKFDSLLAAAATAYFNQHFTRFLPEKEGEYPMFDARTFVVPNLTEAYNCVLWRQQDATKNAVSMAAQSMFSHKELQHKSGPEMQEMMFKQFGVNFNDFPAQFKRGTFARRDQVIRPFTEEQLARIPEKHREKQASTMTMRTVIQTHDWWLTKLDNAGDVLFKGAEPVEANDEYVMMGGHKVYHDDDLQ